MASVRLDTLPKELIIEIASSSDALSVLNLLRTSRIIRAACYDSLVFREILVTAQRCCWANDQLDLEAIALRAGNDPASWARYAVADHKAWLMAQQNSPLNIPSSLHPWIADLSVVNHPFFYLDGWSGEFQPEAPVTADQMFCLARALLSIEKAMPRLATNLLQHGDFESEDDKSCKAYWEFCSFVLQLRRLLVPRLAAWPYNDAARVPYVTPVQASRIPMTPLSPDYDLPLPFSGQSAAWRDRHVRGMAESPSLFDGEWVGYYTWRQHGRNQFQSNQLDPPMTGIWFQRGQATPDESAGGCLAKLDANDCVDGIGRFRVNGLLRKKGEVYELIGRKQYEGQANGPGFAWDWRLQVTPFGLFGDWGRFRGHNDVNGHVWLWKKEWTAWERWF